MARHALTGSDGASAPFARKSTGAPTGGRRQRKLKMHSIAVKGPSRAPIGLTRATKTKVVSSESTTVWRIGTRSGGCTLALERLVVEAHVHPMKLGRCPDFVQT